MVRRNPKPRVAVVRYNGYPTDMHIRRDVWALRDAGFDVDLICAREPGQPRFERVDGITVLRLPPTHRRGGLKRYLFEYSAFPAAAAAVTALRSLRRPYRYIEITNLPDWLMGVAVLPKLLGAQVTLYLREDAARLFTTDRGLSPTHPVVRFLRGMQRLCARAADRVITTQELARQDLIRQGIPADKIVAIPNSPDESVFLARVPPLTSHAAVNGRADSPFRLVTHGTLVKRYGIETLIEAMAILRDRIPGIHLEVIGYGEYQSALEAMVDRLDLQSHVTFAGWIDAYEDVAPRLMEADLGVVPIWTDFQLCNKLVDYLALGIPAITTESVALRPYLDDSEVWYVEPKNAQVLADAILTLYRDPLRRLALAAAGQAAYREHFAWEGAKHTYLAVYGADSARHAEEGQDSFRSSEAERGIAWSAR